MHLTRNESNLTAMRRRAGARIGKMTPADAHAWLARFTAEGITIEHATVRELTGGYASQSICGYIVRKVAIRAGVAR